jgi:branched-chain amino acid transport system permease protein
MQIRSGRPDGGPIAPHARDTLASSLSQVQAAIFGALSGSLFALMALGLSMVWGFLKVINLAHFAMVLLGGYLTVDLATGLGLGPVTTVVITVPLLFLVGAAIQAGYERFNVSELNSLLISYGLLIITVQVVTNIWTADFQRMSPEVNPLASQSLTVGPFVFPAPTLLAAACAVVLVVLANFVLERTYAGRALQAFGQDRQIASAFGIDHRTLGLVLAGSAGASAAVAGMLFAVGEPLTPDAPFEWIGRVFAIVILGGIGNVTGTLYAGMLVGAISGVVAFNWSPSASPLVVFSLVVLALVFRPHGLFPRKAGH